MATVSGLVSGFWRAGAAAVPLHQFCCCPCTAARGVRYYSVFLARRQHCGAGGAVMQSGLAARMMTDSNIFEVPVRLNWLRKTGSGRQFHYSVSHRRDVRLIRELVASGNGDVDAFDMSQKDVHVRGMASSKKKEQPRGSLWRTRSVISKETVQAVHDLKRNKDSPVELAKIFQTRIPRLLKMDLLATLSELQRQNEIELALRIFDLVRKEIWYKPDQFLYREMLDALGRNRRILELETKFQELQDEGIKPEVPIYRELVGAYVRAHMLPEALKIHAQMVKSGCGDDPLSLQFIETGREKEAVRIKQRRKAAEKLDEAEQKREESTPLSE